MYGWVGLRLDAPLGEGLVERLCERFGDILCLSEMFDQEMRQAFRQASTMIQESLNLLLLFTGTSFCSSSITNNLFSRTISVKFYSSIRSHF